MKKTAGLLSRIAGTQIITTAPKQTSQSHNPPDVLDLYFQSKAREKAKKQSTSWESFKEDMGVGVSELRKWWYDKNFYQKVRSGIGVSGIGLGGIGIVTAYESVKKTKQTIAEYKDSLLEMLEDHRLQRPKSLTDNTTREKQQKLQESGQIKKAKEQVADANASLERRSYASIILASHLPKNKDAGEHLKAIKEEIEQRAGIITITRDDSMIYNKLLGVSPYMPTLYAAVLYHLGRGSVNAPTEATHKLFDEAVSLRQKIDQHKDKKHSEDPLACNDYYNNREISDTLVFQRSGRVLAVINDTRRLTEDKARECMATLQSLRNNGDDMHLNVCLTYQAKLLLAMADKQNDKSQKDKRYDEAVKLLFGVNEPETITNILQTFSENIKAADRKNKEDHERSVDKTIALNRADAMVQTRNKVIYTPSSDLLELRKDYPRAQINFEDKVLNEAGKIFFEKYKLDPQVNAEYQVLHDLVSTTILGLDSTLPKQVAPFVLNDVRARGKELEQMRASLAKISSMGEQTTPPSRTSTPVSTKNLSQTERKQSQGSCVVS